LTSTKQRSARRIETIYREELYDAESASTKQRSARRIETTRAAFAVASTCFNQTAIRTAD